MDMGYFGSDIINEPGYIPARFSAVDAPAEDTEGRSRRRALEKPGKIDLAHEVLFLGRPEIARVPHSEMSDLVPPTLEKPREVEHVGRITAPVVVKCLYLENTHQRSTFRRSKIQLYTALNQLRRVRSAQRSNVPETGIYIKENEWNPGSRTPISEGRVGR